MTNAVLSDLETAAIPTAIAVLQSVQAFDNSMGSDPLLWPVKYPGALTVLVGTLESQIPSLAQAEGGAVTGAINAKVGSWISSLQAKVAASNAAAVPAKAAA